MEKLFRVCRIHFKDFLLRLVEDALVISCEKPLFIDFQRKHYDLLTFLHGGHSHVSKPQRLSCARNTYEDQLLSSYRLSHYPVKCGGAGRYSSRVIESLIDKAQRVFRICD